MNAQYETVVPAESESFVSRQVELPRFDHPFHFHPEIEFTYILRSSGMLMAGERAERFSPGDFFVLGSELPHVFRNEAEVPGGAAAEVLQFSRGAGGGVLEVTADLRAFARLLDLARGGLRFQGAVARRAGRGLKRLRRAKGVDKWAAFFEVATALTSVPPPEPLSVSGDPVRKSGPESTRIRRACVYILEHYSGELTHREVAAVAGLAPAAFSRAFRRATGKTYRAFVNEVRLGHACRLLAGSEATVTEVAFASGFTNLSNFNRRFRERMGCTPLTYRRLHRPPL